MSAAALIPWQWQPREAGLAPQAAVAWGVAARRLHARLGQLPMETQARLALTASRGVAVVTGDAADLPWVEGVAYAAPCPEAPALWLPLLQAPSVPVDLLARALSRQHGREPLLLWPEPAAVLPMDRLLPVSATLLAHIAQRWTGE